MNNYQLHRTNVLLGGQLKWDLIINSSQNTLYVSDFHLSPISNNIPYTYKTDEYLIKNTHQDNVKSYFIANKGNFYSEGIDSEYSHNWPVINEENEVFYSKTFDAGCRRSKQYVAYKKQFELFCPLWIEKLDGDISFTINLKNVGTNTVLASNTLILAHNNINRYHDGFIQYLNNYMADAGLIAGSDDVLNISFKNNTATITGLNVNNGIFCTAQCDSLVNNITVRERSLLETDNIIITTFPNNYMVCKQLFNFNLCFNIDDILSGSIANMLNGEELLVSVEAKVGNTVLEVKDFYTEYEYIAKTINTDTDYKDTLNVLDFLHDYECVDLIDKNKFCQATCHWSLCDNDEYIFNVYDGFSGVSIDKDPITGIYNFYENEHQYANTPNMLIKTMDKTQNSAEWIATYKIDNWSDVYKYIKNPNKYKVNGTFIGTNTFINNIKYKYLPTFDSYDGIYIVGLCVTANVLLSFINAFADKCFNIYDNKMYILCKDDLVLILTTNYDYLSFGYFYNDVLHYINDNIDSITDTYTNKVIAELQRMLNSRVEPTLIPFNCSVQYNTAPSMSMNTTEVEYFKTNEFNYVLRYDGKIKPAFTVNRNTLYYKESLSEADIPNSVYSVYNKNEFEPLYPSIGYCAIKKLDNWSYDSIYDTTEHEYSWFNNSKVLILTDTINFTYVNTKVNGTYKTVDDIIIEYLQVYYNTNNISLIKYIKELYNYTNDWEYYSNTNVDDYIYSVSLTLK